MASKEETQVKESPLPVDRFLHDAPAVDAKKGNLDDQAHMMRLGKVQELRVGSHSSIFLSPFPSLRCLTRCDAERLSSDNNVRLLHDFRLVSLSEPVRTSIFDKLPCSTAAAIYPSR